MRRKNSNFPRRPHCPHNCGMRVALGLEYDGTAFAGWQSQPGGVGAQDALESALAAVCGAHVRTFAAGRTDAGVHAAMQIVHFIPPTQPNLPLSAWTRGVNTMLDRSMSVLWAREMPDDFHARFSACGRRYQYLLLNRAQRPGLLRGKVGWRFGKLDERAMQSAADLLTGRHDFTAFRAAGCQAKSPVRELRSLRVRRTRGTGTGEGELLVFDFHADSFLHRMARNLTGALIHVGIGRQGVEWPRKLLESRDRALLPPPAAPQGLYFIGAEYGAEWDLPPTCRPVAAETG